MSASNGGPYTRTTAVTLAATPNPGYTFTGWTIDEVAAGIANPLSLTMNANHAVVATFSAVAAPSPSATPAPASPSPSAMPAPVPVAMRTLTLSGISGGTVAGGGAFRIGSIATITASPQDGHIFTGWTIDGQFRVWANTLSITMDRDHEARAMFAPRPTFGDVTPEMDGATEAIGQLAARGVIKGCDPETGLFCPADNTLRAQMAALIVRAMGWGGENPANPFGDREGVDDELWRAIAILAGHGVAQGYGDGTYGTIDPVLNAQVISFITRAMVEQGYWYYQPDSGVYPNIPGGSGHRVDFATYVHYAGAIPDFADSGADSPYWNYSATREWFARALWRALDSYFAVDRVP